METISSLTFVSGMTDRIKVLNDTATASLMNVGDLTDAQLHYARGRISGLNDAFSVIIDENNKLSDKFKAQAAEEVVSELDTPDADATPSTEAATGMV